MAHTVSLNTGLSRRMMPTDWLVKSSVCSLLKYKSHQLPAIFTISKATLYNT